LKSHKRGDEPESEIVLFKRFRSVVLVGKVLTNKWYRNEYWVEIESGEITFVVHDKLNLANIWPDDKVLVRMIEKRDTIEFKFIGKL